MPLDSLAQSPDTVLVWLGIAFCISQSAMFSGLNLAVFSVSRLRLEVEAAAGNPGANRVLAFRQRSNHILTTILWGNVGINVLLALLSDSVMSGMVAFLFSTVLITLLGEIAPQAYFSRHALRMAALLAPLLRFYVIVLYPFAKPSAMLLDIWLGQEGLQFYREHQLREVIRKHIEANEAEIDRLEGIGALNFLALDDLAADQEGTLLAPDSVITLPFDDEQVVFPAIERSTQDAFLRQLADLDRHWVVITDPQGEPRRILDAERFLREAFFDESDFKPARSLYRPAIVREPGKLLGQIIPQLQAQPVIAGERGEDVILIWGEQRRLITGDDILRRLLSGILPPGARPETAKNTAWPRSAIG